MARKAALERRRLLREIEPVFQPSEGGLTAAFHPYAPASMRAPPRPLRFPLPRREPTLTDLPSYNVRYGETGRVKAYDFKVLLEPDETGGYVATCPSLPGCDSQGDTVDGALDNIREAIELCLEDMQAHGEVIPDPSRVLVGSVVVTR
jgi:antitoxin HicB